MKRSEAREQAFTLVFEYSFGNGSFDEIIAGAVEGRSLEIDTFALDLVHNVEEHLTEIDQRISRYSSGWKIERLPRVTLAVLRVACAEILWNDDVPDNVAINEAIELAKKYSSQDDASYVNGILGSVVREKNEE